MSAKILLVDDSRELLNAYVAYLQSTTSHEVRTAFSAREALEILHAWRPDVVVTDVIMPDLNGLELITQMRSQLPPPLPLIIAMSGFPDFEREALRRGAQAFQAKPIDTDDLVVLIDSLLAHREPPEELRTHTKGRRQALSEAAQAATAATLARRPYFGAVARLGARLLSRYFGDPEAAFLLFREGRLHIFAASDDRWPVGAAVDGITSYAIDVVESGSTLIVPDLAQMPSEAARAPHRDWRFLAAVPLRTSGEVTIGAVTLADRRPIAFDIQDLRILEHVAACLGEVFSGVDGAHALRGPGVLRAESWQCLLDCEVKHLGIEQSLVIALASTTAEPELAIPVPSAEAMRSLEQAVDQLVGRLPPRTVLGRLAPDTLAAYTIATDPAAGERALATVLASLEEKPRGCVAMLSTTGLAPTDGGAALLDIAHWLLASSTARGPGTALSVRIDPATLERRLAA